METESYEAAIQKESDKTDNEHLKKVKIVEKADGSKLMLFYAITSMTMSLAGWVALVLSPTPDVEVLDAACFFLISYILQRKVDVYAEHRMMELSEGPKHHLSMILNHNAVIGRDIREIKNFLNNRGQ